MLRGWVSCVGLCGNKDRFEESVIEERRRTAQDLLNFVGQRIYLTSSVIFKQFFQVCLLATIIENLYSPRTVDNRIKKRKQNIT